MGDSDSDRGAPAPPLEKKNQLPSFIIKLDNSIFFMTIYIV